MVPPDSSRISRVRPYLRTYTTEYIVFADGAITLYGGPFQGPLANNGIDCPSHQRREIGLATLSWQRLAPITPKKFRLFPFRSPLLRESRPAEAGHIDFFSAGTKMFQFSACPPRLTAEVIPYDRNWVPPFGDPRVKAYLAARRGLSQLITSFIGTSSRGIHSMLFLQLDCNVQPLKPVKLNNLTAPIFQGSNFSTP